MARWRSGATSTGGRVSTRDSRRSACRSPFASEPTAGFPFKNIVRVHRLKVTATKTLYLTDLPLLADLGVNIATYQDRNYRPTENIADAAYFLGFDALVVPSARWSCANAMLFTDRIDLASLTVEGTEPHFVNWSEWRRHHRERKS
ncbi:MAG: RES domain-containing protein [Hyphomicrobiales bacterium]|nr:RES domain-containing protein [Hyphomicrobiales bacterium]